jgi:hypothetical protein
MGAPNAYPNGFEGLLLGGMLLPLGTTLEIRKLGLMKNTLCLFLGVSSLLLLSVSLATAASPRFGFSGVLELDLETWDGLALEEKMVHLNERLDWTEAKGVKVLRLGSVQPNPLSRATIESDGSRDWALADHFVKEVNKRGLSLCATLPELVKSSGLNSHKQFMAKLIERYDGDADFGVAELDVNKEHPDVDGSGSVTFADWGADNATKKSWAQKHMLTLIEIGDQPNALEMSGELEKTDYGLQLAASHQVLAESKADMRLMLGTTAVDNQTEGTFQTRLEGVEPDSAFDVVSGAFDDAFADISGDKALDKLKQFFDWPSGVAHPNVDRWVGSLRVGGAECVDSRCDERLKSSLIAKAVFVALEEGYMTLLYGRPIDTVEGDESGAGLWTRSKGSATGGEAVYSARPSAAMWMKLSEIGGQLDGSDVVRFAGDNPMVVGYRVGDLGWIYWYNWTRQVGPGEPYGGKEFEAVLEGLESSAVRVTKLWKEQDEEDWPEEVVLVDGGKAVFMLGQDIVWVTTTEAPTQPDPGPSDDLGASVEGPAPGPESDGGGCSTHNGTDSFGLSLLLLLLLSVRAVLPRRA